MEIVNKWNIYTYIKLTYLKIISSSEYSSIIYLGVGREEELRAFKITYPVGVDKYI